MAKRRILYAAALLGCVVFYGAYQQWFSWILLLTMLLFPWFSLLMSLRAMFQLKLEPHVPVRVPMGSHEEIMLSVRCNLPHPPIKCRIKISKPATGETWVRNPGEALPAEHCGGLITTPCRAWVYDYLGLFRFRVRRIESRTILVMPGPVTMQMLPDLSGYLSRSWHPKPGGGYAENHEIRQYHPGDNLNQVHWKLSAKMDELMLREPMEPERGLFLLTLDVNGTPSELDLKFGRLIWLGNWLLDQQIPFEIRVLSGNGIENWPVQDEWDLRKSVDKLLLSPFAVTGSIQDRSISAAWHFHIGGDPDEA